MKIQSVRFLQLIVIIILFWATGWLFLWWLRPPNNLSSSSSVEFSSNPSTAGQFHLGDGPAEHKDTEVVSQIPVYIVEEHHEVIKYWYAAANQGYIPKKGNVLLHIDGHSDGGTSPNWRLGPLFRFPVNHEDITNMMQRNDVFIIAAALTGLISRYIWVFPSWNTELIEMTTVDTYVSFNVRYGSMYNKDNTTGEFVVELCACISSKELNYENYCVMNNITEDGDSEGMPIRESECHMTYSGLVEILNEVKAISLIKSGTWITEKDSVLLDVDEDFYGVEASIMPLYDAGVDKGKIDTISMWVRQLVCASNTQQERQTDSFFNDLIQTIIDFKIFCSMNVEGNEDLCSNSMKLATSVMKQRPSLFENLRNRNIEKNLCDKFNSKYAVRKLVLEFCTMSVDQLRAFVEVGICLEESIKTMGFQKIYNMRVCHGYNTPNESMVMFYVPTLVEIEQRTDNLKDILKQKQFTPGAVTICRSSRDGYTPRKYLSKIESDIKHVLRDAFPKILEDSFYYDEDLLGGHFGWYERH